MILDSECGWYDGENERSGWKFQLSIHLNPEEVGEMMCGEVD